MYEFCPIYLKSKNITIHANKCVVKTQRLNLLGRVITLAGVIPGNDLVRLIVELPSVPYFNILSYLCSTMPTR